jgi:hypothetical protein
MAKKTLPKPARKTPSLPPEEEVMQTLERLAKSAAWRGELTTEQSSELKKRTSDLIELDLITLFSASLMEGGENLFASVDQIMDHNTVNASLKKRLGSRLAHHQQWDALLRISTKQGFQKFKAELQLVPTEIRSNFAAQILSNEKLASDDPQVIRHVKRDLSTLATWAIGNDATTIASVFLEFTTSALPKSKLTLAKLAARCVAVTISEDSVIAALNSGRFSSLQLANLVDLVAKTPQGSKYAQSFIVRISQSKRSEALENDLCWHRLDLLDIGQLTKFPEILSHLSAQPAWWTARQRRELMAEGVGAILRFVDCTRKALDVVDTRLLGEFLRDSKRPGNALVREAFESVVKAALTEQSTMHEVSLAEVREIVADRDTALKRAKSEQAQLQTRIQRLEEQLRNIERSEIQSRVQKDVMAQRVMIDLIVELALAMQRMSENAANNEQVKAFVAEAESLMARASVSIERNSSGRLVAIRQGVKSNEETLLYPKP